MSINLKTRDRESHLTIWLSHLHPLLIRQNVHYQVFVVEQDDKLPFNRAALMNAGYQEIQTNVDIDSNFDCYIFHDVDMVPETDFPLYKCSEGNQVSCNKGLIPKYLELCIMKGIFSKYLPSNFKLYPSC